MGKIRRNKRWVILGVTLGVFFMMYALVFAPPTGFPSGKIFVIKKGEGVSQIANNLAEARLISHAKLLPYIFRLSGTGNTIQAGAYSFSRPESILTIAWRLGHGDYGIPPARITLVEGMTVRELAVRVAAALPEISAEEIVAAGKEYEGYLFPDTYIFPPGADAESVIETMRENFAKKIAALSGEINASGHTLADVMVMASLLEKEARQTETRRIIAGILWRRLAINMPLQVDAVFGYIFARPTFSPSYTDLKVDSPYNTYTHRGLPPGPINNPGLDSIEAALNPTKTPYLFYLTGRDGTMHYASTYAQHQANQRKYLPSY